MNKDWVSDFLLSNPHTNHAKIMRVNNGMRGLLQTNNSLLLRIIVPSSLMFSLKQQNL